MDKIIFRRLKNFSFNNNKNKWKFHCYTKYGCILDLTEGDKFEYICFIKEELSRDIPDYPLRDFKTSINEIKEEEIDYNIKKNKWIKIVNEAINIE